MKKGVRITCTIAASIVALLLLIAFTVSPIAEFYIEKNSEKLIGRKIAMNDLSINLFSGKVVIDGLTVNEHESNDTFLSLNRFETRINLLPLLWKSIDVKRLYFDGLYVQILQNGQTFNFSDFIEGEENPETTEPEEKPDEAGSSCNQYFHIRERLMKCCDKGIENDGRSQIYLLLPYVEFVPHSYFMSILIH